MAAGEGVWLLEQGKQPQIVPVHKFVFQQLWPQALCLERCIPSCATPACTPANVDSANGRLAAALACVQRVGKALDARIDALVVLEALKRQQAVIEAQFKALHAKEAAGSMSNAEVRRMNRARAETDQVEQAKAAGERTHGLMARRNRRDAAWYRATREHQFAALVLQFAEAQAALQAALGELWLGMASRTGAARGDYGPDLEDVVLDDLGTRASESAEYVEPEEDGDAIAADTTMAGGALPAEHAEQAGNGDGAA